ncbi:hypothetical protein F5B19DRAFT_160991 [Rostrohypoxylon terebratum]|nr:hypothetical protein F5B19DRAFT_160991 [Rostrohypoxylon terebratum]
MHARNADFNMFPPFPPADFADRIAKCKIAPPDNLKPAGSEYLPSRAENTYTCLHKFPCPRQTCVIHGNPSSAEISAKIPHKVGGYWPENPRKMCELDGCGIHTAYHPIYTVDPRGLNIIRSDENINTVPGSVGLGIKPWWRIEQEEQALAKQTMSLKPSEQPGLIKGNDIIFIKPDRDYILTKVDRSEDPGPTTNRDFLSKIFKDEDERKEAFQAYRRDISNRYDDTPPLMLTYGIQYAPEPGKSTQGSRKVLITGLDPKMPLYNIMSRVRGGKVLKVTTAKSPMPIGYTVIVEFVHHEDAKKYVAFAANKVKDVFTEGVDVTLLKSDSYPISMEIQNDLNHKFTRLVVYLDFTGFSCKEFVLDFEARFTKPQDLLEDMWMDDRRRLWILFKTVYQAGRFYKQTVRELEQHKPGSFDVSLYRFAPDPCDAPVQELCYLKGLDGPVNLARGKHASLLDGIIEGRAEDWDWVTAKGFEKEKEEEEDEESAEVGRATPAEEEALISVGSPSPDAPSDSRPSPTHYHERSVEEKFRDVPGLGAATEFRRHQSQSRHTFRRHRRDSSLTQYEKPKDEPGVLEQFCEEQMKLRRGERSDSTTPANSQLHGDIDNTEYPSWVTVKKNDFGDEEDKVEDKPVEEILDEIVRVSVVRDVATAMGGQRLRNLRETPYSSRPGVVSTQVDVATQVDVSLKRRQRANSYANNKEERESYDKLLVTYSAPQPGEYRKKYPLTVEGEIERLNDKEKARRQKEKEKSGEKKEIEW